MANSDRQDLNGGRSRRGFNNSVRAATFHVDAVRPMVPGSFVIGNWPIIALMVRRLARIPRCHLVPELSESAYDDIAVGPSTGLGARHASQHWITASPVSEGFRRSRRTVGSAPSHVTDRSSRRYPSTLRPYFGLQRTRPLNSASLPHQYQEVSLRLGRKRDTSQGQSAISRFS